jgi:plasmid stabilization system protein ParE
MAGKTPKLKVQYSPQTRLALDEIWEWNAERYDVGHADEYVSFLEKKASGLATAYPLGKIVPTAPELRYIIVRRTPHGHAHVVVYKVVVGNVNVINIFHTAQDWQNKLARDEK